MAQLNSLLVTGNSRFINKINGDISGDAHTLDGKTITDTYSSTSSDAMSGKAVASALGTLDGTVSGSAGVSKTLTAFSQTNGKVTATFGNISITKSQVNDFPSIDTTVTSGSTNLITSGAVYTAIDNLPEPMVFKGTLGTGGTITTLPTASTSNEGFTYKVITAGTYASQSAKVGDVFVSNGTSWVLIPSGDDTVADTWRNIKINGTEKLGTGISTGAVDFVNGTGTTASFDTTGSKVSYSVTYGNSANTACQGNDSRLSNARTPTSHSHGNIQNGGTLQTTDITIANGDKLVVTDSSDSSKIARTSIAFDGSTTTKALTQKGTFESFDSVSQTNTTTNANYRVLLSHSANNDTETAGVYKNQGLYFNTSSGIFYPYRTVVADYLTTPKLNGFECGPSLAEFKAALGIKDLLWENTNAFTSAFAARTVSIDLSNYSEIIIDYVNYKNNGTAAYSNEIRSSGLVVGGGATYLIAVLDTFYRRSATVTTSGVTFSGAYQEGTYNNWSGSWGIDNNAVVPYRIWGWNPPHLAG